MGGVLCAALDGDIVRACQGVRPSRSTGGEAHGVDARGGVDVQRVRDHARGLIAKIPLVAGHAPGGGVGEGHGQGSHAAQRSGREAGHGGPDPAPPREGGDAPAIAYRVGVMGTHERRHAAPAAIGSHGSAGDRVIPVGWTITGFREMVGAGRRSGGAAGLAAGRYLQPARSPRGLRLG